MERIAYWTCFTLVFLSIAGTWLGWLFLLHAVGGRSPLMGMAPLLSFGSLVPIMLAALVPRVVHTVLGVVMLLLLLRRIWLLVIRKERVPHSFRGFPRLLGYVGAASFGIGFLALVLTVLLRAGSGVPAGLLLLPAVFCVPWAFFLTEVFSLRKVAVQEQEGDTVPMR